MTKRLIDSSTTSSEKQRKRPGSSISEADVPVGELVTDEDDVVRTKRELALDLVTRGRPRRQIANQLNMTEAEVFRIEEDYFASQEVLSEPAQLAKQMERLGIVLDKLWSLVVDNSYQLDAKLVEQLLKTIDLTSDLAGLKKTRMEAEVRVIQERQVPVIINFIDRVQTQMEEHLTPLLTADGRRMLESHRDEWLSEATAASVGELRGETTVIEM